MLSSKNSNARPIKYNMGKNGRRFAEEIRPLLKITLQRACFIDYYTFTFLDKFLGNEFRYLSILLIDSASLATALLRVLRYFDLFGFREFVLILIGISLVEA